MTSRPSSASPGGHGFREARSERRASTRAERWLVRQALRAQGIPPFAVVLWDGREIRSGDAAPGARVRLGSRSALRALLWNPELGLGDAYVDGTLEVEGDLVRLVEAAFRAHRPGAARRALARLASRWGAKGDTQWAARRHIHHHYDLGNDFYALWLDERMVYTCAYFPTPDASLEAAQLAKMEHVCRKLALRPGERVVEAGCGWGALALHMARHHGVRVRAFNISTEQIAHAREQAQRLGLAGQVEFVEDDYRNVGGRYDAFVSVGMLEHVGRRNYRTLGGVIDRCLAPHGRGLVHSIGRSRPQRTNRWIERRIFPGSYMPSLREMMDVFEPFDLTVLDVENLRPHYARTLEHWLERFEKASDRVRSRFDERFVRAWRLYLASSIAAFRSGSLQLYQVVFARRDCDRMPWTRAHVYERER